MGVLRSIRRARERRRHVTEPTRKRSGTGRLQFESLEQRILLSADPTVLAFDALLEPDDQQTLTLDLDSILGDAGAPGQLVVTTDQEGHDLKVEWRALLQQALSHWSGSPFALEALADLDTLTIQLTDLPGSALGQVFGDTILLDADAGGHGWFLDGTPGDHSEFTLQSDGGYLADEASGAFGRMDLLTVLTHEIGHVIGLDHGLGQEFAGDLMAERLHAGERLLPALSDADHLDPTDAQRHDDAEGAFLLGPPPPDLPDFSASTDDLTIIFRADGFVYVQVNGGAETQYTAPAAGSRITTGTGSDTFVFESGASYDGSLDGGGGAGSDTVQQTDGTNAWSITGAGTGAVTDLTGGFTGIEALLGGSDADTFDLQPGGSVTNLNGGGGHDVLDYSSHGSAGVTVDLTNTVATTGISGLVSGIEEVTGTSGADTLTGNTSTATTLTGGAGTDALTGGSAGDLFTDLLEDGGSVTAGAGTDTLVVSATASADVIDVTPTDITLGTTTPVTLTLSGLEQLTLSTLAADDVVTVTPVTSTASLSAVLLDAGPDTGVGRADALTVDADGNLATTTGTAGGPATITIDGSATVTYSNVETVTLDNAGYLIDGDAVDAGLNELAMLGAVLDEFGDFDTEVPLTPNGGADPDTAVTYGDLINSGGVLEALRAHLDLMGSTTSSGDFETSLEAWDPTITDPLGNIEFVAGPTVSVSTTVSVDPVTGTVSDGTADVAFTARRTSTFSLDQVESLNLQGVHFDPAAGYVLHTDTTYDFQIALDADFFVDFTLGTQVSDLSHTIDGSDLAIGVLGARASATTTFDHSATMGVVFDDDLTLTELQAANADAAVLDAAADVTATGSVEASFTATPHAQIGFAAPAAGTVNIGDATLDPLDPSLDVFTDLPSGPPVSMPDELQVFTRANTRDLLDPLDDFATFLGDLVGTEAYGGKLPIVDDVRIGDVLDFSGALRSALNDHVSNQVRVTGLASPEVVLAADTSFLLTLDGMAYTIDLGTTTAGNTILEELVVDLNTALETAVERGTSVEVDLTDRVRAEDLTETTDGGRLLSFSVYVDADPAVADPVLDRTAELAVFFTDPVAQRELGFAQGVMAETLPAFSSVQELVSLVGGLGGPGFTAAWGAADEQLTFDVTLAQNSSPVFASFIQNLELGLLEKLDVAPNQLVGASAPSGTGGNAFQLGGDATLELALNDGAAETVELHASQTATNTSLQDLAGDLANAIDANADLAERVGVAVSDDRLVLFAVDGADDFTVSFTGAAAELGFVSGASSTDDLQVTLRPSLALGFTYGLDLTAVDASELTPVQAVDAAQTGKLTDTAGFTLEVSRSGSVDPADDFVVSEQISVENTGDNGDLAALLQDVTAALADLNTTLADDDHGAGPVTVTLEEISSGRSRLAFSIPDPNADPDTDPSIALAVTDLAARSSDGYSVAGQELGIQIGVHQDTGGSSATVVSGQLNTLPDPVVSDNIVFDVQVGGVRYDDVTVFASATTGAMSAADLVDDFDAALSNEGISGIETVVVDGRLRLRLTGADSDSYLAVFADEGNPFLDVFGFVNGQNDRAAAIAPAFFDASTDTASTIDGTVRIFWGGDADGRYGFVDLDVAGAAAQGTVTLATHLAETDGDVPTDEGYGQVEVQDLVVGKARVTAADPLAASLLDVVQPDGTVVGGGKLGATATFQLEVDGSDSVSVTVDPTETITAESKPNGPDDTMIFDLDGTATLRITVDGGTAQTVVLQEADTDGLQTIEQLAQALQDAVDDNPNLLGVVRVTTFDGRLVLEAIDGMGQIDGSRDLVVDFDRTDPAAAFLGFSAGQQHDLGELFVAINRSLVDAGLGNQVFAGMADGNRLRLEVAADTLQVQVTAGDPAEDELGFATTQDSVRLVAPLEQSGALNTTNPNDLDYVLDPGLRAVVGADSLQFAIRVPGHASGESNVAANQIAVAATMPDILAGKDPAEVELGLGNGKQSENVLIANAAINVTELRAASPPTADMNGQIVLTGDAHLSISVDAAPAVQVTLSQGTYADLDALAQALDTEIDGTVLDGDVYAVRSLERLVLKPTDPADELEVTLLPGDPAEDLGFVSGQTSVQLGRLTTDAEFEVAVDGGTALQVQVEALSTSDNANLTDLVDDVNAALIQAARFRLGGDANFQIHVNGTLVDSVQVLAADTANNVALVDPLDLDDPTTLVGDLRAALADSSLLGTFAGRLTLSTGNDADVIRVTFDRGSAASELGFVNGESATGTLKADTPPQGTADGAVSVELLGERLTLVHEDGLPLALGTSNPIATAELGLTAGDASDQVLIASSLAPTGAPTQEGILGADATFELGTVDENGVFTGATVVVTRVSTLGNESLADLAAAFAGALPDPGPGFPDVRVQLLGTSLVLTNLTSGDPLEVRVEQPADLSVSTVVPDVFDKLDAETALAALQQATGAVLTASGDELFDDPLPLLSVSAANMSDYANELTALTSALARESFGSLQELVAAYNELAGLEAAPAGAGTSAAGLGFSIFDGPDPADNDNDKLTFDLIFESAADQTVGFNLNVSSLALFDPNAPEELLDENAAVLDATGGVELDVMANATVDLDLALSFAGPEAVIVLNPSDDSRVDLVVDSFRNDLRFKARFASSTGYVGSPVGAAAGTYDIGGTFEVDFVDSLLLDGTPLTVADWTADLTDGSGGIATGDIRLPLFANASASSGIGTLHLDIEDLRGTLETYAVPDSSAVIVESAPDAGTFEVNDALELLRNPQFLIDGLDRFIGAIQTAIETPFFALSNLPLVGDAILDGVQPALDDLNQMRLNIRSFLEDQYFGALDNTAGPYTDSSGEILPELVLQEALFDLFAGSGDELNPDTDADPDNFDDGNGDGEGPRLGILVDLADDGNATVDSGDVILTTSTDVDNPGFQYDFHLGQSYRVALPFELGFGVGDLGLDEFLPNFGFNVDASEGVTFDLSWDLRFGFGISANELFYINSDQHENVADTDSEGIEELQLGIDVTIPGFNAEVALGLVGGKISDGTVETARVSSLGQVSLDEILFESNGIGLEGAFQVKLYRDTLDDRGDFVSEDTDPIVLTFDNSGTGMNGGGGVLGALSSVQRVTRLIGQLNSQLFEFETGGLIALPDLSNIDLMSNDPGEPEPVFDPGFGIRLTSRSPDVTRIEVTPTTLANGTNAGEFGNNFGFGVPIFEGSEITGYQTQYEDMRAVGLGFSNGQGPGTAVTAQFAAPTEGLVNHDTLFELEVMAGGRIKELEVMLHASKVKDTAERVNPDGTTTMVSGLEAFVVQLNRALSLTLLEAEVDLSEENDQSIVASIGSNGRLVLTASNNVQSILEVDWSRLDTSFLSLKLGIDLKDPGEGDENRLTLPELFSKPNDAIRPFLSAEGQARFHVNTNSNHITDFVENLVGFGGLGLPEIDFDFKTGFEFRTDPTIKEIAKAIKEARSAKTAKKKSGGSAQANTKAGAKAGAKSVFAPVLEFANIQVNLGDLLSNMLGPILDGIQEILGPVIDIVGPAATSAQGFLNEPLPVLSDISSFLGISDEFSLLDFTGNKQAFNLFMDQIIRLIDLIDKFNAIDFNDGPIVADLGCWQIDLALPKPIPLPCELVDMFSDLQVSGNANIADLLELLGVTAGGTAEFEFEPGGFKLDFLAPENILNLILGETFDIFSFNLPTLHLDLGLDLGFDFDVLNFNVAGGVTLDINLGFGYDSTGLDRISEARNLGLTPDYADLLDGFYIRTVKGPELSLGAYFKGGGGVDLHIPRFCVDLGFLGTLCTPKFTIFAVQADAHANFDIGMDLRDPNEDGKLRIDEVLDLTNDFSDPQNLFFLFDIVGSANFGFSISGTILGFSLSTDDLPGIEFTNIGGSFSAQDFFGTVFGLEDPFTGTMGEIVGIKGPGYDGGEDPFIPSSRSTRVLRINAGEFAYARIHGDTDDEDVGVRNWKVSSFQANAEDFDGGTSLHDFVRVSDGSRHTDIDVTLYDVDSILFRGTELADSIDFSGLLLPIAIDARGLGGDDSIVGGAGNDLILGGRGNDTLDGGGSDDALYGGEGQDWLVGGGDRDILIGGKENDVLAGGSGADTYLYGSTRPEKTGWDRDTVVETNEMGVVARRIDVTDVADEKAYVRGTGTFIGPSGSGEIENVFDQSGNIRISSFQHGLSTNQEITISGVEGVTDANGTFKVFKLSDNTLELRDVNNSAAPIPFPQPGRIRITAEGHGLSDGDQVSITGIGGVSNANGTHVVADATTDAFLLASSKFIGNYERRNGAGFIFDDTAPGTGFGTLTDTLDFRALSSSKSLIVTLDANGTSVTIGGDEEAVDSVTLANHGVETFLGGKGNEVFTLSDNGGDDGFSRFDGGEGSDDYIVIPGADIGDAEVLDTGFLPGAKDRLFLQGTELADLVGLTNQAIVIPNDPGDDGQISYGGNDSGLELIRLDMGEDDDEVWVESTPSGIIVTVNGERGSDTIAVGVDASTGANAVLETILGPDDLVVHGYSEDFPDLDVAFPQDRDTLIVSDGADPNANVGGQSGHLTSRKVTGLGLGVPVDYQGMETVEIRLGLAADLFDIDSTIDGIFDDDGTTPLFASVLVNAGPGADVVNVNRIGYDTDEMVIGTIVTVQGGTGEDKLFVNPVGSAENLLLLPNELFLDGGGGADEVEIDLAGIGSSLIHVDDSGAGTDGTDLLTVNGTDVADEFQLRKNYLALLHEDPVLPDPLTPLGGGSEIVLTAERVNYTANLNRGLVMNGHDGDDYFAVDDNGVTTTLNGSDGEDTFQIGQMFGSKRDADAGLAPDDRFDTIHTTKGWLSTGASQSMTVNGGEDNDVFVMFHNQAPLSLNGGEHDDTFTVRAFALFGSRAIDPLQQRPDIDTGSGNDMVEYAINAPVAINGGSGTDTVVIVGTEFGDQFVLTEDGVFGSGLTVSFVGIEIVEVDGLEGNDDFYVLGTDANIETKIFGGLGHDTFNVGEDAPPGGVDSNDLRGHSGIIAHGIEAGSAAEYLDIEIEGVSVNVGDDEEPGIVILETDGFTSVTEGGATDTYAIVLTKQPTSNVRVTVSAPALAPEDQTADARAVLVSGGGQGPSEGIVLEFTPSDWSVQKFVTVHADNDDTAEGIRFSTISHSVGVPEIGGDRDYAEVKTLQVVTRIVDNDAKTVVVTQSNGSTSAIESGDEDDAAPFTDTYSLVLSKAPTANVTVDLVERDDQLRFFDEDGDAITSVTFGPVADPMNDVGVWNTERVITVVAFDDTLLEGGHFAIVGHAVSSGDAGENGYDGIAVDEIQVELWDDEAPMVVITEVDGSTDVIEGSSTATDTYSVVLTKAPSAPSALVTVSVFSEETFTSNFIDPLDPEQGLLFQRQVEVDGAFSTSLTFGLVADPMNGVGVWNVPQFVTVSALDAMLANDDDVDGGERKVFANVLNRVHQIRGALSIEGGIDEFSDRTLPDPLLYLEEQNAVRDGFSTEVSTGDVLTDANAAAGSTEGGFPVGPSQDPALKDFVVVIVEGTSKGERRTVVDNTETTLKLDLPLALDLTSQYVVFFENPNLEAFEPDQIDTLNVTNAASVAADVGVLTSDLLSGLGMGPAGIAYRNLEALNLTLGFGADDFTIESTHTGTTTIRTGIETATEFEDTDHVRIETVAGPLTVFTGEDDDRIDVGSPDGLLDTIGALLTLDTGIGAGDVVNLDDSADTEDSLGQLTESTLVGLDMPTFDTVQFLTIVADGGTFTLIDDPINNPAGTGPLAFDASSIVVREALEGLFGVGNVLVDRTENIFTITFVGALAGMEVPQLQVDGDNLTSTSGDPEATVETRVGNALQSVTVEGTSGAFTLQVNGFDPTEPIALGESAEIVKFKLERTLSTDGRSRLGFNNVFARKVGDVYLIGFQGELRGQAGLDLGRIVADASGLDPDASIVVADRREGINYYRVDELNLDLGSGDDRLNVQGTSAETNVDTADGDDLIYVSSGAALEALEDFGPADGDLEALHEAILNAPVVDGPTGDRAGGTLDFLAGDLNVEAGAGQNTLTVSDRRDPDADTNVVITEDAITGLAEGDVTYVATGGDYSGQGAWARLGDVGLFGRGVNIYGGTGGNTIDIQSTDETDDLGTPFARTLTSVFTGEGSDVVTASVADDSDRALVIRGQEGADSIDATASTLPLVIFGDVGSDVLLKGGTNENLVFGDGGRVYFARPQTGGGLDPLPGGTGGGTYDIVLGGAPIAADLAELAAFAPDTDFLTWDLARTVLAPDDGDDHVVTQDSRDTVFGGNNAGGLDTIHAANGENIVLGDNGKVLAKEGSPWLVASTEFGEGGDDDITTGNARDIVIAGFADDDVDTGSDDDIAIGDSGFVDWVIDDGDPAAIDRIRTTLPALGGDDEIHAGAGADTVFGGTAADSIFGEAGPDLIFGDHGFVDANLPVNVRFTAVDTAAADLGGDDTIEGGTGDDTLLGQQGDDRILGGDDDDDIIGGHNVADGIDELAPFTLNDVLDGGAGNDFIVGDNADVVRRADALSPRFRLLEDTTLYAADGSAWVADEAQLAPTGVVGRDVTLYNHGVLPLPDTYGNDSIAGGAQDDVIFGQLGDDVVQGDGSVALDVQADGLSTADAVNDGDDYVEGNGGDDLVFGNLGQDDLIGGSSSLFSLSDLLDRPDGSDTIYGGAGTDVDRNTLGDESAEGHALDADVILGDNGNIYRVVEAAGPGATAFLSFAYDDYSATLPILPRAIDTLDYSPDDVRNDVGAGDLLHGEAGDDSIHGLTGDDTLFGEGQDDDIFGGTANDWIAGGSGDDGVLADDGKILTSRNGVAEPLYAIEATTEEILSTPGNKLRTTLRPDGQLSKEVDLEPFDTGGTDTVYGGLGNDSLHGGAGNDALSGAEALAIFYADPGSTPTLDFDDDLGDFDDFDDDNPLEPISGHLLNFQAFDGNPNSDKIEDGEDRLFGDLGNDWLVGGTGEDHLFAGLGNDILNSDDRLDTTSPDNGPYGDEDTAFGGGGRDTLIANTRDDRQIDWLGEYNAYIVPFAPFGGPTNTRAPVPHDVEFLYDISESDGADQTRVGPDLGTPERNGEPFGELGLVLPEDPDWGDQSGPPSDPQPGNVPGGQVTGSNGNQGLGQHQGNGLPGGGIGGPNNGGPPPPPPPPPPGAPAFAEDDGGFGFGTRANGRDLDSLRRAQDSMRRSGIRPEDGSIEAVELAAEAAELVFDPLSGRLSAPAPVEAVGEEADVMDEAPLLSLDGIPVAADSDLRAEPLVFERVEEIDLGEASEPLSFEIDEFVLAEEGQLAPTAPAAESNDEGLLLESSPAASELELPGRAAPLGRWGLERDGGSPTTASGTQADPLGLDLRR